MKSSSLASPDGARRGKQPSVPRPWRQVLSSFVEFQLEHRGVPARTAGGYSWILRRFAAHVTSSKEVVTPDKITVAHIDDFLVRHAHPRGHDYCRRATTSLRVLLRYLALDGRVSAELATQVPTTRTYALAGLPRGIDWDDVLRVLGAMPRDDAAGRRNYAILMLLSTYGLRAGDVAALRLDDVHWRDAKIAFRMSKNGRHLALPLLDPVGDAVAEYVRRDRARCEHREIFLSLRRPFRPLAGQRISVVAQDAIDRGGVERVRGSAAHRLRHTTAMHMLRAGVDRNAIADFLGHAHSSTTERYAHADLEMKRKAIESCAPPPETKQPKWRTLEVLDFLDSL